MAPHPANLQEVVTFLDELLDTQNFPDYPNALNGLQLESDRSIQTIASAVDFSQRTIASAIAAGADLLLLHHGMFWGGLQPLRGPAYHRVRALVTAGIAVYASHLPLDAHPSLGNNARLATVLGLTSSGGFARYRSTTLGVAGACEISTATLVSRVQEFSRTHGGEVRTTPVADGRRTRRWAICTGAGASSDTLREAADGGVDTLIVGEGPHHTAVDAEEFGLVIVYAGHYATETLGVRALAEAVANRFALKATFIDAPTGT